MFRSLAVLTALSFFAFTTSGCASTSKAKAAKQAQAKKAKQQKLIGKTKKRFNPDDYSLTDDASLDENHLKKGEAALAAPALDSPDSIDSIDSPF